jgi:hypothetical protein
MLYFCQVVTILSSSDKKVVNKDRIEVCLKKKFYRSPMVLTNVP